MWCGSSASPAEPRAQDCAERSGVGLSGDFPVVEEFGAIGRFARRRGGLLLYTLTPQRHHACGELFNSEAGHEGVCLTVTVRGFPRNLGIQDKGFRAPTAPEVFPFCLSEREVPERKRNAAWRLPGKTVSRGRAFRPRATTAALPQRGHPRPRHVDSRCAAYRPPPHRRTAAPSRAAGHAGPHSSEKSEGNSQRVLYDSAILHKETARERTAFNSRLTTRSLPW